MVKYIIVKDLITFFFKDALSGKSTGKLQFKESEKTFPHYKFLPQEKVDGITFDKSDFLNGACRRQKKNS